MNLVKAAELLKNAPENTLKQYLANPNGEFPEYLVASEIARRDDMRKRYAAELSGKPPKTSIIEELLQRDNAAQRAPQQPQMPAQMPQEAPPEAMGLGAVPPPPDMQLSPAPIADAAQQPQQFAGGGAVAFAGGGDVLDAFNEYMRPSVHSGDGNYRAGVSPSFPVGEGSVDLNANVIGSPGYGGYQGRVGGSYPIGDGRLSAGISGIADKYRKAITGYDVGYGDGANRLSANILPSEMGNTYGINYNRQLDKESAINAALMRDPRGQMSGNLMYTKRFASGGPAYTVNEADYQIDPTLIQQREIPTVQSLEDYRKQAETALGPSGLSGYQEMLAKQRADLEGRQKNYLPDFLIQAGLGMATSKGNPLQAAAEGAAQGFKFYQQSKQSDEEAKRNLVESEFKFKQAERAERAGLFSLSRDLYKDAVGQRNDAFNQNRQAETLRVNAIAHRDDAKANAARLGVDERRLTIEAARAASEAEGRRKEMELKTRELEDRIANRDVVSPAVRVQAAQLVSGAYKDWLTANGGVAPDWYNQEEARISTITDPTAQAVARARLAQKVRREIGISPTLEQMAGL